MTISGMTPAQRDALKAARSEKPPVTSAEAYAQMDRMLAASAQMAMTSTGQSGNGKSSASGRKTAA